MFCHAREFCAVQLLCETPLVYAGANRAGGAGTYNRAGVRAHLPAHGHPSAALCIFPDCQRPTCRGCRQGAGSSPRSRERESSAALWTTVYYCSS